MHVCLQMALQLPNTSKAMSVSNYLLQQVGSSNDMDLSVEHMTNTLRKCVEDDVESLGSVDDELRTIGYKGFCALKLAFLGLILTSLRRLKLLPEYKDIMDPIAFLAQPTCRLSGNAKQQKIRELLAYAPPPLDSFLFSSLRCSPRLVLFQLRRHTRGCRRLSD